MRRFSKNRSLPSLKEGEGASSFTGFDFESIAAGFFSTIKLLVGGPNESILVLMVLPKEGRKAHAQGDLEILLVDLEPDLADLRSDFFGDLNGGILWRVTQKQNELFPPVTREQVFLPFHL